jgi:hypothetical protein
VPPKPFATAVEGLAWLFSSQAAKPVNRRSRVLRVWTKGTVCVPLGVRLCRKGGPSNPELAWKLLSSARTPLRGRPEYVLWDAWYPSRRLLKRIHDYG